MSVPDAVLAGRYRLIRRVGAGGMSVVWEARDERLHRTVAVKQLRPQLHLTEAEAELAKRRAMREARITARLVHPHTVPVFDVVEHDGQPCLILQFLPSEPLSRLISGLGALSPEEAVRVGGEVASALTAAHALGIVHRDVKPGNVLIAEDGTARISDFGISHALGDVSLTATGFVHGTPAFLAPEVARGEKSGFPADVFGLGATLYAAVEGVPPFGTDENPMALLHRVSSGRIAPPHRGGVLTPLLDRMLAADPKARPPMAEVAQCLGALLQVEGASSAVERLSTATIPEAVEVANAVSRSAPDGSEQSSLRKPPAAKVRSATRRGGRASRYPRGRALVLTAVVLAAVLAGGFLVDAWQPALRGRDAAITGRPAASSPPAATTPSVTVPSAGAPSSPAVSRSAGEPRPTVYTSTAFVVPFTVTAPTWIAPRPGVARRNLVTWQAPNAAVRFLVPVQVYPPGRKTAASLPRDYPAYLLAHSDQGVRLADRSETTVGGRPATILTATANRRFYGAIGCPEVKLPSTSCYGLRPERRLRIAVVGVKGTTLLIWLRNDRSANFQEESRRFEEMLTSVRFR